uniref:Reverse transcriptase n=1 Tax=Oryzias latipes TaxID=8090 RepID=O93521_ORYLA|nr:reverse transcriptase [Oryzias latipes]
MYDRNVKLLTLNINGLHNPVKRWKTLSKLKQDKAEIVFLQETHLPEAEHLKLNKMGFKHVFYSSHSSGRRRGGATLIAGAVNYQHVSEYKDKEGRYIMITGKINSILITLLNVYVPPGSDWSFYRHIFEIISTKSQGTLICGGDFNIVLNNSLDSSNGKGDYRKIGKKMRHLMEEMGIVDVWRENNPTKREYTHYSHPHNAYSRLDYIFMFKNDLLRVKNSDIGICAISDHNPVTVSLYLAGQKRTTVWRLNNNILNYPNIKDKLSYEIKEYLIHNDNGEVSPGTLWDALKAVLRGKIISISSYQKKASQQKLKCLEEKLLKLQQEHFQSVNTKNKTEIIKLKKEIDDINTLAVQKKLVLMKQKYYEVGSKSLKLLSYKLRKQQAERAIYKIKNPSSKKIETDQEKIQQCFHEYYKNLYSETNLNNSDQIDAFLKDLDLPTLTVEQNEKLLTAITEEEIQFAIRKLKSGKMAGADGFSPEWYKTMETHLIPTLLKTFNWVMEKKTTPLSWNKAIISIIPKEGKDRLDCANYRPVSVLNIDYKLFTSIISRRLETILPMLIHKDQTGFIKQRQTQDSIRKVLHIIHQVVQQKQETLVISLDAEKAFDSVRWTFLYKVLGKFGFCKSIIETISGLYNKPTARIKINGDFTETITLERGTRQGCNMSALLFALYIEPLGQWIRQRADIKGVKVSGKEQKLSLFADDLLLTISQPTKTLPIIMDSLKDFGTLSGYKINVNKTQVLTLNYSPPQNIKDEYKWEWQADSIKYLGIALHKDFTKMFEVNYGPLNTKLQSDLQRWNAIPFLDLHSRIDSIRMNILPRMLYLFQCLPFPIPQKQFVEWDKMLSRYIWRGKKPRIKYKTLQLKTDQGGRNLPCLQDYFCAAQLRPLICMCSPVYTAGWKDLELKTFEKIPLKALLADLKLQGELLLQDDPLLSMMIKTWNDTVKKCNLMEDSKILRWCTCDSEFTPNKYDGRFKLWIAKGLTDFNSFVHKGAFQTFDTLKKKHGLISDDFFRYLQVRHYFNQKIKISTDDPKFLKTFKTLIKAICPTKIISKLYNSILSHKGENTYYVKERWEREGRLTITEEDWEQICRKQWITTGSNIWREFCWKSIMRFFTTPSQKKYLGNSKCWRCGNNGANHFHIFWDCVIIKKYWSDIHEHLQNVFSIVFPLSFESLFLSKIDGLDNKNKKLLYILLAASKKAITRKWLKPEQPTTEDWIDVVQRIYIMERISHSLQIRLDVFYATWSIWTEYVKPVRSDFI